jgi:hypothetical protein
MVLATEMSKHFEHLNKFVNKFSVNENDPNQVVLVCFILDFYIFKFNYLFHHY